MDYKQKYKLRIDELNELSEEVYQELDLKKTEDMILEMLEIGYFDGVSAANEMIGSDLEPNMEKMNKAIFKEIGGENIINRIEKYSSQGTIDDYKRLIESEYHRLFNEGVYDTGEDSGKPLYKKWVAIMDERTRDDHWALDGVVVKFNDYFYEPSGDYGRFPGDFLLPESNVNCRCAIELSIQSDNEDE